jgi:Kae1-associated kinase Bud32
MMPIQMEKLAKGAEANVFRGFFLQTSSIMKQRHPKTYRLPKIDQMLRFQRLRAEARILVKAWKLGVKVPTLLGIDSIKQTLMIEEIPGKLLFSLLNSDTPESLMPVFKKIGMQVAILHRNDIIHGDLTVFNIIVEINEGPEPWLIDFGLSQVSVEIEKKADDLFAFSSTLKAISVNYKIFFEEFQKGYLVINQKGNKAFEHMKKIQSRARYIAREDRM